MLKIKLMGAIRSDWGENVIVLKKSKNKILLKQVLDQVRELKKDDFKTYFDNDLTPKRGTIIIINGVDYKIMGGLDAKITTSDEIILIPTISGG
jgi:molybdopterin converting factor small subunit